MKFSILICTYNRQRYIYNVLQSIALTGYPVHDYEIVLVDNNCTDNTRSEADRFAADYPDVQLNYVVEKNQGLSYARNTAIRSAKGDILIYVDDDAKVEARFLNAYDAFFASNPDAMAAGGKVEPVFESTPPRWMSKYTKHLIGAALNEGKTTRPFKKGRFPSGCNAAFRAEIFEQVGLFNPELGRKGNSLIGAEEKDIFDRMTAQGIKFYYLPDAVLFHLMAPERTTNEYFKKLTYGVGKSERIRTLTISKQKFYKRLFAEAVKWAGSIVLCVGYTLVLAPAKGWKLIQFRANVTKGLLGK